MALTPIPQNFKKGIDWIIGAYEDSGVSFPNGFQKDAIQNAAGAKKNNKWKGWNCDISLLTNEHGTYVIVEDSGTVGLTGNNIPAPEVYKMMAEDIQLPADERLARFSSMFNSGGNEGAGLYGAGKSVYAAASDTYTYYFDSLRDDNKYVANAYISGQVEDLAFEDSDAEQFIRSNTGLQKKESIGTRIIIESPRKELVESIESGEIINYIQESWWLIIQRLPEGSSISVNGVPVPVPEGLTDTKHKFDLKKPEMLSAAYKVKHFGLYLFEDGSNIWSGISYYRKGMKIGSIDIKDPVKSIEGKYWGYIEVDEPWEAELAEIEDKVHFGVSARKKTRLAYQKLKNYCTGKLNANLVEWGFIKDKENEDKRLKDELRQIAEEIQDLFDDFGYEDLGKGPNKPDFDIRWQDVRYPEAGTEKVTTGDVIDFSVRITSTYAADKTFEYRLYVENPETGETVSEINSGKIKVHSNTTEKLEFSHSITKQNSIQFAENKIKLIVKVVGSGKDKKRELPYYFDIDKPVNTRELVNLVLHSCTFPREMSRRVNFGESIKDVSYFIDNKRNYSLNYRLNISIHNAEDSSSPKIVDVASYTGTVAPYETVITPVINEIPFDQDVFDKYISEGTVELRARLIANEDDPEFEKGDRITYYYYKLFLNKDEKSGKYDAFDTESVVAPDEYRRSWYEAGAERKIYLNVGHAAYLSVSDYPEIQHEYMREQMLKQYVLLYMAEGMYDMFDDGDTFVDLTPPEAAERVLQKIESVYYRSLK